MFPRVFIYKVMQDVFALRRQNVIAPTAEKKKHMVCTLLVQSGWALAAEIGVPRRHATVT